MSFHHLVDRRLHAGQMRDQFVEILSRDGDDVDLRFRDDPGIAQLLKLIADVTRIEDAFAAMVVLTPDSGRFENVDLSSQLTEFSGNRPLFQTGHRDCMIGRVMNGIPPHDSSYQLHRDVLPGIFRFLPHGAQNFTGISAAHCIFVAIKTSFADLMMSKRRSDRYF